VTWSAAYNRPVNNLRPHLNKLKMPDDVSPHVLRHSFASLAGDLGRPDHTIARMLGHRQSSITSRYIHMEKTVIEASNIVANETMRLMQKGLAP
jgi:site-specific recombinase XerD